jgi:hypothetical protein
VLHTLRAIVLIGTLATKPMLAEQSDTTRATSPTQKACNPSLGTVSGRIFLIAKGRDLKPARLARVYLSLSTVRVPPRLRRRVPAILPD